MSRGSVLDRWLSLFTRDDEKLYAYAISRALSALIDHSIRYGRGWYHLADGEVIVAAEVTLP